MKRNKLYWLFFGFSVLAMGYVPDSHAGEPDPAQVNCLAKNIYHEARGEGRLGMLAVASVTLNRVQDGRWGETVCDVVYAPKQFSWANHGEPPIKNARAWSRAYQLAIYAMTNARARVTQATFYAHRRLDGRKRWMSAPGMERLGTIGRHVFYRDS